MLREVKNAILTQNSGNKKGFLIIDESESPFYYPVFQTLDCLLACQGSQVGRAEFVNMVFDIFKGV